ncbi:MAG: hypothetical protein JXJ22_18765 [Bacteroidales bacterium]|nr:hypothetical protein [Bacteroidales bacterium]
MKKSKKIISILSVVAGIIIIVSILLSVFFKPAAISLLRNNLDNYLVTEIEVDDINFSFIKRFPFASIELKNVLVKSTLNFAADEFKDTNTDTLLTAQRIFLEFDLFSLIKNKYKLKNILIKNGELSIYLDKSGLSNYKIWDSGGKSSTDFQIALQNFDLNKMQLNLTDLAKKIKVSGLLNRFNLKGNFSQDSFQLSSDFEFYIEKYIQEKSTLIEQRSIIASLSLLKENNTYFIQKGKLIFSDLPFQIEGKIQKDKQLYLDFIIHSEKLKIDQVFKLIPEQNQAFINQYSSTGILLLNATIKGYLSGHSMPHIESSFELGNGILINRKTKFRATDIFIKGRYSNGSKNNLSTTELIIENISAKLGESSFQGQYSAKDFTHPFIRFAIKGEFNINDLTGLYPIKYVKEASGKINFNLSSSGTIKNHKKISKEEWGALSKDGTVSVSDVSLVFTDYPGTIQKISGKFHVDKIITFQDLFFTINDNDFLLNGSAENLMDYLMLKNYPLILTAEIQSENLNLNSLLNFNKTKNKTDTVLLVFPKNIQLYSQLKTKHFKYNRFQADDINCILNYHTKILSVNQLQMNTMQGRLTGKATLKLLESNELDVRCETVLNNMDIRKLFYSFNNFNQKVIEDKHLQGALSGNVNFFALWDNELNVKAQSITVDSDIKISNGELINYAPLNSLSKFIDLEELKNIKFQTLENSISIRNKTVFIPYMDISSSAFNISGSGEHHFDLTYTYRIRVYLSEILSGKARKNKKENIEYGIVESKDPGKINIYLLITGDEKDVAVVYDKKRAFEQMKVNMNEEKKELRNILHEEFGAASKRERTNDVPRKQGEFIFEWDERDVKKDSIFESQNKIKNTKTDKENNEEFEFEWNEEDDSIDNN